MNTQRNVYILNFSDTLYTLQLDAYTVVPYLYGPLAIGHEDYTAKFMFMVIAFSKSARPKSQTVNQKRCPTN